MNLVSLMWVDSWGRPTGNMIRIGAIVLGAVLYLAGSRKKKSHPHEQPHHGTDGLHSAEDGEDDESKS